MKKKFLLLIWSAYNILGNCVSYLAPALGFCSRMQSTTHHPDTWITSSVRPETLNSVRTRRGYHDSLKERVEPLSKRAPSFWDIWNLAIIRIFLKLPFWGLRERLLLFFVFLLCKFCFLHTFYCG